MKKFYQITSKSFAEHGVKNLKELWNKLKGEYKGLSACVQTEFKKSEDSKTKFNVIMSTSAEDRHGDIVEQNWILKNFKKNPVFLDSHNYSSIEHILGKVEKVKVKDKNLVGEVTFMTENPKGDLALKMAQGGFLSAVSVGFIPMEFDNNFKILKSELLELSAVSVPANQEALFEKKVEKKKTVEKSEEIEEPEEKPEEKKSVSNKKLEALKRLANKKEFKRKEILKESLAVMQRLNKGEVEAQKRRKMVNRVVRNMIKIK